MISGACVEATELWVRSREAITIRSLIFPPLIVFDANASLVGQLDRNEFVELVGFSASLADLRIIAHDIERRRHAMAGVVPGSLRLNPEDIASITGLLRIACFSAADFWTLTRRDPKSHCWPIVTQSISND